MHEYIINLHMHTRFSDGHGSHTDIVTAAQAANIDVAIVTDHNVWVQGPEGYYENNNKKILLLIGEEVHDQTRQPQKNHLLVVGAEAEMATYANDPQQLIDNVNDAGGLSFIAHPNDPSAPLFSENAITWENWEVSGYTGIELWNALSEFKGLLSSYSAAIFYAFNFDAIAHGPNPETLKKWDALLSKGGKVVAVGGSDAHQLRKTLGPFTRILFPYEKHFKAINTHILLAQALSGSLAEDKKQVYDALRQGHAFIGNDSLAPTLGFRFTANCQAGVSSMGDTLSISQGATLQVKLPLATECHLICDGEIIRSSHKRESFVHQATKPGVYRIEAYLPYKGKRRGWIFSNPIYLKE